MPTTDGIKSDWDYERPERRWIDSRGRKMKRNRLVSEVKSSLNSAMGERELGLQMILRNGRERGRDGSSSRKPGSYGGLDAIESLRLPPADGGGSAVED
jgi:hypothetical protein